MEGLCEGGRVSISVGPCLPPNDNMKENHSPATHLATRMAEVNMFFELF